MERRQLEQRLLGQGGFEEVVAGLRLDNGQPVAAAMGEPVSDGRRVGGPPAGDITAARAHDGGIRWQDVVAFLPEFADASAERFLDEMRDRYRDNPSDENADLLLAALNRIGASERLRHTHARLVEGAKELLQTGEGLSDPAKADAIWFEVYTDADFGGREWFTSMTPGWAYWRTPDFRNVRAIYANNVIMQDVVSSIQYGSSPYEAGGQVVLFEDVRYDGRYRNFTVPAGKSVDVPWIGNDFNDTTSSSLIIRRFPNEWPPVKLSQIVPKAAITSVLDGVPSASLDGAPIYTWDMWPNGPKSNSDWHPNDDNAFIEIIVPLTIHVPSVKVNTCLFHTCPTTGPRRSTGSSRSCAMGVSPLRSPTTATGSRAGCSLTLSRRPSTARSSAPCPPCRVASTPPSERFLCPVALASATCCRGATKSAATCSNDVTIVAVRE